MLCRYWFKYAFPTCSSAMQCPAGTHYTELASACPATCAEPDGPESCDEPPSEACECSTGKVLLGNICVEKEECGCTDPMGIRYKVCYLETLMVFVVVFNNNTLISAQVFILISLFIYL